MATWKDAWWHLSNAQKRALAQGRAEGKFGGAALTHPYYWYIQEVGDSEVRVRAQMYIRDTQADFRQRFSAMAARRLRA